MVWFPDNRGRYAGKASWHFTAGTPRADNPVQTPSPKETPAVRGTPPRDSFRVTTAEPPVNPPMEWVQNAEGKWVQEPIEKPQDAAEPATGLISLGAVAAQLQGSSSGLGGHSTEPAGPAPARG